MSSSYNNPLPVVVGMVRVLVGDDMRLLAVRRGIDPKKGELALPGGYIDPYECAEDAVARELREETGLDLPAPFWRPVATRVTQDNRLLMFMLCSQAVTPQALEGFVANSEVEALVPVCSCAKLGFPLHEEMLKSRIWR